MRGAKNIAEGATPTEITALTTWTKGLVVNTSDTTIYLQFTHETDTLSTSNGLPIPAGYYFDFNAFGLPSKGDLVRRPPVYAVHPGTGNKEIRYVFE